MIALLKIYRKTVTNKEDGKNFFVSGARPYAIYENKRMQPVHGESLIELFPNSGKVFTNHYPLPEKDFFGFFELEEATQYNSQNYSWAKYCIKNAFKDINLFEVINIDVNYETQKDEITNILQAGISVDFTPSDYILLKTNDDYIIGPVQLEKVDEMYYCQNDNYICCYKNKLNLCNIYDSHNNSSRWFTVDQPNKDEIVGWLDVASIERVVSEVLKFLKDNDEFGDMSRRVIKGLKNWYTAYEQDIEQAHFKERLNRALSLIKNHTLDEETTEEYLKLFSELEISKNLINSRVVEQLSSEYDRFQEKNKKLIKEVTKMEEHVQNLDKELNSKKVKLKSITEKSSAIKENMEKEIVFLKEKFVEEYVKQLKEAELPTIVKADNIQKTTGGKELFTLWQTIEGTNLGSIEKFKEKLQKSINEFKGNDSEKLAETILTAIMLNEPILLYGKGSHELAKVITYNLSSSQTLILIPELETVSLSDIHKHYTEFEASSTIKSLIIHEPHTTSALYSLPIFFKEQKWAQENKGPDLTIITLSTIEEAKEFIDRIPNSPLIAANKYMKSAVTPFKLRKLYPSSLELNVLEECYVKEESSVQRRRFIEWIEDEYDLDLKVPLELMSWLNQLTVFNEDENEMFEWIYENFKHLWIEKVEEEL